LNSITIVSDDLSGIESLIKRVNSKVSFPGIKGNDIETLHKIKDIFGGDKKVIQVIKQIKNYPELIQKLEVNHGST
jgi:hypothetical protein